MALRSAGCVALRLPGLAQPITEPSSTRRRGDRQQGPGKLPWFGSNLWCQACLAGRAGGRYRLRPASHREADACPSFACQAASAQPAQGRWPAIGHRAELARPGVPCRASEPALDRRLHLYLDRGGLALRCRRHRPLLPPCGGLVDEARYDRRARDRCADDGDLAQRKARCPTAPFGPGQPGRIQPVVATSFRRRL